MKEKEYNNLKICKQIYSDHHDDHQYVYVLWGTYQII